MKKSHKLTPFHVFNLIFFNSKLQYAWLRAADELTLQEKHSNLKVNSKTHTHLHHRSNHKNLKLGTTNKMGETCCPHHKNEEDNCENDDDDEDDEEEEDDDDEEEK